MVDVPYLDHLWDSQKDCLDVGQVRCFHEETSRKLLFWKGDTDDFNVIQFPPEMDENWVRYGLAKLGQISRTKLAEDAVLCVHNTASALNR